MSNSSLPKPHLERHPWRDGTWPAPPRELTLTPVERPLTATQERNMRLASQEPELPEEREIDKIADGGDKSKIENIGVCPFYQRQG